MVAPHSGVAPLNARGGVPLRPLEVDCKESLFPTVPELLDKLWLSCPDPRLERHQGSTREGGMCFAICQHIGDCSQRPSARLIWGDSEEVIQKVKCLAEA